MPTAALGSGLSQSTRTRMCLNLNIQDLEGQPESFYLFIYFFDSCIQQAFLECRG